jgi:hypothetical protein
MEQKVGLRPQIMVDYLIHFSIIISFRILAQLEK